MLRSFFVLPFGLKSFLQRGLCLLDQLGEAGGIADRQISQNLAVELDARLFEAVHEAGVVDVVELAGGRNTGDPKPSEITLFELSARIRIGQRLHDRLIGDAVVGALSAPVALGHLERLFSSLSRHQRAFNTCHNDTTISPYVVSILFY